MWMERGWNGHRNESVQKVDPGEGNSPSSTRTFRSRLRLVASRELNDIQVAWNSVHWGAEGSSVVRATDS